MWALCSIIFLVLAAVSIRYRAEAGVVVHTLTVLSFAVLIGFSFGLNMKDNCLAHVFIRERAFSPDVCEQIILAAEKTANSTLAEQDNARQGWDTGRHAYYPTTDQDAFKMQGLDLEESGILQRLNSILAKHLQVAASELEAIDIFVVKYDANGQSNLTLHRDGSHVSFSVQLSAPQDFEGGGINFDLVPSSKGMVPERGAMVIHPSRILHEGVPITEGKRYVLVGFIEVKAWRENMWDWLWRNHGMWANQITITRLAFSMEEEPEDFDEEEEELETIIELPPSSKRMLYAELYHQIVHNIQANLAYFEWAEFSSSVLFNLPLSFLITAVAFRYLGLTEYMT